MRGRRDKDERWAIGLILACCGAFAVGRPEARGQAPTLPEGVNAPVNSAPGGNQSTLGAVPGSGGGTFADQAVGAGQILGGRPGAATPRVPTSISNPGAGNTPTTSGPVLAIPNVAPLTEVPLFGTLEFTASDDEGPADGLTFDAALDLLLRNNLDLLARQFEIPAAQADILTASLRANPIFYADSQLVPYGEFTPKRPGGQTQYDVNVSYPVDFSHKRRARTANAIQIKRGVEAQYQDAVRLQIGNLANAYVGVLAARETARYVATGLKGLDTVLEKTRPQFGQGNRTSADIARITAQRGSAVLGLADAEEAVRRAKRTLGGVLNLDPIQAEALEIRASLRDDAPPPPSADELVAMALRCRPDVVAFRLGVNIANTAYALQRANRYADAYVLLQPYTFQNNSPNHLKSSYSFAVGATVPLPIYNRNQGNIERAKVNIQQTKVQLNAIERLVNTEVIQAEREYRSTRDILARLETNVLPVSKKVVDDTRQLFLLGEVDVTPLLNAQRDANDIVRQYRDTAVRHRRSMLNLNTAVGQRVLP